MVLDTQTIDKVTALLGRAPRGLEAVAVARPTGEPMVIRVASLVDDKPFPTLYWLIDPDLCYRIDQVEAGGLIKRLQGHIDSDTALQEAMREDHRAYIRQRAAFTSETMRKRIDSLGFAGVFANKGVGGIGDFTRIRCLHTWYAAHLVEPNTVGSLLEQWWAVEDPGADQVAGE